jgi:aspartate kinase
MGETTDQLVSLAAELSEDPSPREMDMLLSAGERISMALLAITLNSRGIPAVSYTGSQAGILTDASHGSAKILDIKGTRVRDSLADGRVVIVAGFHGVFTADPRIVPQATKLDEVPFDEMLELSAGGAGVLMSRAVEFGRRFEIPIHVRSSFRDGEGTWVRESAMEQAIVSGIAHDRSEAKLTVNRVPDRPGVAAALFGSLAAANVNVDMIVQNVSHDGTTDISFTVPRIHVVDGERIAKQVAGEIGAESVDVDPDVAKVSLVGAGMKSHPGVAARVFKALSEAGINIEMISTSTIRISCVIRAGQVEKAVQALHSEFKPPTVSEEVGA